MNTTRVIQLAAAGCAADLGSWIQDLGQETEDPLRLALLGHLPRKPGEDDRRPPTEPLYPTLRSGSEARPKRSEVRDPKARWPTGPPRDPPAHRAGYAWQPGHQKELLPRMTVRRISAPQRRQASPSRP